MCKVSYNRYQVPFYLWLKQMVLKLCKILKYHEQDCSGPVNSTKFPPSLVPPLKIMPPLLCFPTKHPEIWSAHLKKKIL